MRAPSSQLIFKNINFSNSPLNSPAQEPAAAADNSRHKQTPSSCCSRCSVRKTNGSKSMHTAYGARRRKKVPGFPSTSYRPRALPESTFTKRIFDIFHSKSNKKIFIRPRYVRSPYQGALFCAFPIVDFPGAVRNGTDNRRKRM